MEENEIRPVSGIIVIGGSAGSFEVIFTMLQQLSVLKLPMIIILHRKSGVDSLLTNVMSWRSGFEVKEAEEKEYLENGKIYIAPADYHLLVENDKSISLDGSEKVNFSRPSIDVSFESAGQVFGKKCTGILLSGGNADGVKGLKAIKEAGGLCCVQDPDTAEIAYMPAHAIDAGVASRILKPGEMGDFISSLE